MAPIDGPGVEALADPRLLTRPRAKMHRLIRLGVARGEAAGQRVVGKHCGDEHR